MNSPHFSMKNKITEGASELEKQRRSTSQDPKRKAWGRGCARAGANRKRRHKGHRVRVGGPRRVLEQHRCRCSRVSHTAMEALPCVRT